MPEKQDNKELINETLQLMQLSSMDDEERTMWTVMLPSMTAEEILKFKGALEREVQKMTEIFIKAKQSLKK